MASHLDWALLLNNYEVNEMTKRDIYRAGRLLDDPEDRLVRVCKTCCALTLAEDEETHNSWHMFDMRYRRKMNDEVC